MNKKLPITVIILTYNEEHNIEDCINSVKDWVDKVFIVDSYSDDNTVSIAKDLGAEVAEHEFENYSKQRNWSLKNLDIKTDWVINLDADHRVLPKLKESLFKEFKNGVDDIDGFLVSRRAVFLNKWIKHGGIYPTYHAPIFKKDKGYCEHKKYDQHFIVEGKTKKLKGDIKDIITESLTTFTDRHNYWATLEVDDYFSGANKEGIKDDITGDPRERRRSMRNWYYRVPIFLRSFLYFIYRYFIRLGFLDGKEGLIFHSLQGFWYRFLVDAKIYEYTKQNKEK